MICELGIRRFPEINSKGFFQVLEVVDQSMDGVNESGDVEEEENKENRDSETDQQAANDAEGETTDHQDNPVNSHKNYIDQSDLIFELKRIENNLKQSA